MRIEELKIGDKVRLIEGRGDQSLIMTVANINGRFLDVNTEKGPVFNGVADNLELVN